MNFKSELANAEAELLKLEQQKIEIERKMKGWICLIEGYRTLNEESTSEDPPTREEFQIEQETPSLPSKVLAALIQAGGRPIGATQIRDWLVANRAADPSAENLLINIHTTLKRLIPERVEQVILDDGSKLYKFVTPMERALKEGAFVGRRATLDSSFFKPTPRVTKK